MKAVVYAGPGRVEVREVPEPAPADPGDAIVRVTHTSICGSDLHLLDGKTPGMRAGGVIGHEFTGVVETVGSGVGSVAVGDAVLGSFLIACGGCHQCAARRYNFCANRRALGLGTLTGDLDGAQAELVRVPNAELNLRRVEEPSEAVLFGGDILATGFYGASLAEAGPGRTVAVIGAGPVGLFCAAAARRAGADVLVFDADARRAAFARERMGLEALAVSDTPAASEVAHATGGRMADAAIDAVGAVAVVKEAMRCVRDGGRVVVLGVYGAERWELPMGVAWVRGIDLRFAGMANVQAHWDDALDAVARGELDPAAVITHRLPLQRAEEGYELFRSRAAMKVVLQP